MGFLTVLPVVPDAVYRIRSVSRNPNLYLEWQTDNNIQPLALKPDSDAQKWKISRLLQTGNYIITNVASNANLSTLAYTEGNETRYRLFSGGSQAWNLEPRVDQFVIGVVENDRCIDLADNDWLILWPRHNGQNQRFALESVQPAAITSGTWCIKNRSTDGQLLIWTGSDAPTASCRVWPTVSTASTNVARTWTVAANPNGAYSFASRQTLGAATQTTPGLPRWLNESDGAIISRVENACRLIPVPGTDFYYIALNMSEDARVLMDTNARATNDGLISTGIMVTGDTRQHWQIYAPN